MQTLEPNWLKLVKKGDQTAFQKLYEYYQPRVFRLAIKYTKNEMDAEDVVQEVFATVYKQVKNFREESSFDTWLYRITVNAALMKLRARRKEEHISIEDNPDQVDQCFSQGRAPAIGDALRYIKTTELPLNQAEWKEFIEELVRAGEEMGKARWEAFALSVIQGMSEKEVTTKLRIGLNALKSRVHRGRKFLKKRMKKYQFN